MNARDDFVESRRQMIAQQLKARGIKSSRVLAAMDRVPRELFISDEIQRYAYSDQALAIECDQTISQPYIVALMTDSLELSGCEHVLEIGTGSGYQTAILAELAGDVVTIERHQLLLESAEQRLNQLGYQNVRFVNADGHAGFPDEAPFDRIMITAAAPECPPGLMAQLNNNGILVGPFGPTDAQSLQAIRKTAGRETVTILTACRFVPLINERKHN